MDRNKSHITFSARKTLQGREAAGVTDKRAAWQLEKCQTEHGKKNWTRRERSKDTRSDLRRTLPSCVTSGSPPPLPAPGACLSILRRPASVVQDIGVMDPVGVV